MFSVSKKKDITKLKKIIVFDVDETLLYDRTYISHGTIMVRYTERPNRHELLKLLRDYDNDDVDYTQLKVTELKAIAQAKGLTNYKSLKKTPLIELIKSSE